VPRRRKTAYNPARHRRAQVHRQQDRRVLNVARVVAKAAYRVNKHHGSTAGNLWEVQQLTMNRWQNWHAKDYGKGSYASNQQWSKDAKGQWVRANGEAKKGDIRDLFKNGTYEPQQHIQCQACGTWHDVNLHKDGKGQPKKVCRKKGCFEIVLIGIEKTEAEKIKKENDKKHADKAQEVQLRSTLMDDEDMNTWKKMGISYKLFNTDSDESMEEKSEVTILDGVDKEVAQEPGKEADIKTEDKIKALKQGIETLEITTKTFEAGNIDNKAEKKMMREMKEQLKKLELGLEAKVTTAKEKPKPGESHMKATLAAKEKQLQQLKECGGGLDLKELEKQIADLKKQIDEEQESGMKTAGEAQKNHTKLREMVTKLEGKFKDKASEYEEKKAKLVLARKEEDEKLEEEVKAMQKSYDLTKDILKKKIQENQELIDSLMTTSTFAQPYIQKAAEALSAAKATQVQAQEEKKFDLLGYFNVLSETNDLNGIEKLLDGFRAITPLISAKIPNAAAKDKCRQVAEKLLELDSIVKNGTGATRDLQVEDEGKGREGSADKKQKKNEEEEEEPLQQP
jgi:hypothetical protein